MHSGCLLESLNGREHLEDLDVIESIVLKWSLGK
jgi:hypothetical protein